ncbi:hypothetical protein [Sinomonas sp. P47F7]|uniref:hypothetical protein n=1 Tax=Sinomonas sp. P47F7 TaxID=3410987 RepID=UPI003BF50A77
MAAAIAVLALVYFPLELLITCGLLLVVALVWRSRSPRAGGSGLMPMAVVWGAVGALVLSMGAVAARTLIPGFQPPSAASASSGRFGAGPGATEDPPSASPSGATPSPTISVQSAEAAQHLTQASVPEAPPAAPAQGGGAAGQPAAPAAPATAASAQPASTAQAAAPQSPPAVAARPSSPAQSTSAPASTPAPSPSQVPEKQDCLSPLNGLVTVKICS